MISHPADDRKAETRSMIFQAARKVFSEKGYHKTQISDIVKASGTSTGSIYAHFRDKRDLFEQIARETLEDLRARLRELSRTTRPGDIRERVSRWHPAFTAFFDYVEENPEQILLIVRGGFGVDEDLDTTLWEFFKAFASDIAEDIRKWEDLGFIRGVNAMLMGHTIIGMCLHVAFSYLLDREFTREEAILNLMAITESMIFRYLTAKGMAELGCMPASGPAWGGAVRMP
ncbi:MAG: HTH-type transcriptional regulator AcrR [Deltaproteobacteria bacterium ADurb.BinA179]|nr:MAG: HTH-type transcriptional regulator AcrR [Deltaproteobacteria bacterium ADurb.BinA179]HNU75036.1 TetR/AcrR family transcriptional regulator [Deltaproteobacteria bacterium]HPA83798.1 TetR/AcrR family transcriptional regulator [Deltaproteobacteria bacterium]HQQ16327.1 TetR/AcrR family transcriptional regulator [Deltaproteobacteria bacterium]